MRITKWSMSYIDLAQPQHNAPLRSLISALMKSVGERGEFRIDETVEVRITPLKKRLRKSLNTASHRSCGNIVADLALGRPPRSLRECSKQLT
jgi:hypothetical protein